MRLAHAGVVGLALTTGCWRIGYERHAAPGDHAPDASLRDAGTARALDGSVAGAGTGMAAAVGGRAGSAARNRAGAGGEAGRAVGGAGAGASAGTVGSGGAGSSATGADGNQLLGNTGLHVSDILGFYSGDWGDMVLRKQGNEVWGAYKYSGGTIVGLVSSDGVFTGWWSQLPLRTGLTAGEVEFRWSQTSGTVIALDGRWRYGSSGEWLENWDVDLVTDRAAPDELNARFDTASDFKRHP